MEHKILKIDNIEDKNLTSYLDVMGISTKLNENEKKQFLQIAKEFGLNPFKREIFCTVYGEGSYKQFAIITGYEVYIKRAERSGLLDGWKAETSGSVEGKDLKATVTIYRKDRNHPFIWQSHYSECVQKTKDGKVTKFWEKAHFMTKKVAISQGFRLCFSDELGGMPYTSDEMPNQEVTENIGYQVVETTEPVKLKPLATAENLAKAKLKGATIEEVEKYYTLTDVQKNEY